MLDEIIKEYKSNIDTFFVSRQKYKWIGNILFFLYLLLGLTLLISFPLSFINPNKITIGIIIFSVLIMIVILFILSCIKKLQDKERTRIISERYTVKIKDNEKINDIASTHERQQLKTLLKQHHITKTSQCDRLIYQLEKKIKRETSEFFLPSIFGILFIPVWIQFCNTLFKNTNDLNEALNKLILFIIVIFIIVVWITWIKPVVIDIKTIFSSEKKLILIELLLSLQDIAIHIEDD